MKKWFLQLNQYYKVAFLSLCCSLIIFLLFIPFYFFELNEIPQGFILGAITGIIPYFLYGLIENKERKNKTNKLAITLMIFRFLLIGVVIVLAAVLYYKLDAKIFNVFAVVGGYFVTLILLMIVFLVGKKHGNG